MANSLFSQIPVNKPKRNFFDLSHDVKMTLDMGKLVPTMWIECYPGDSINIGASLQLRFAPLIAPVMHLINWYVHFFFVPYRVMWSNWEKYYQSPTDMTGNPPPVFPYMTVGNLNWAVSSVFDYIGVPQIGVSDPLHEVRINAMIPAAYNKIYVDYYMDENMAGASAPIWELVDGDNPTVADVDWVFRRAWEKDYFTSALPFAQKGPTVNLPIGTLEDVRVFRNTNPLATPSTSLTGAPVNQNVTSLLDLSGSIPADELWANTSSLPIGSTTINDFRRAMKLQEFLERMARGGSRPTEITRSVFGVTPPDYRLQRAEYVGGARGQVIVSEVLNTSGSFDDVTGDPTSPPQGNMSGHAIGVGSGRPNSYFCTEHGIMMGIMSVMPKPAYKDGVHPSLLAKGDPLDDLAWPQFGNLGEQPIKNVEVYADIPNNDQEAVFGYTPRYAQHKYMPNRVAGEFRTSLAYWTLVRDFTPNGTTPVPLDINFINCVPTKDIFAVVASGVDSLYAHVYHTVKTKRCFPKWGVPSI